jgi:four helix bundle protein
MKPRQAKERALSEDNRRKREEMMRRTKRFALAIIRLSSSLPRSLVSKVLGGQVLRSGTSVGAHYREACRAKSRADFVSKIEGTLQELDETTYWLELLQEIYVEKRAQAEILMTEANELISIFVSVVRSVKLSTPG